MSLGSKNVNIKMPKGLSDQGKKTKAMLDKIFGGKGSKSMTNEINLIPDIKEEMIKTLKLRNLIFFLCIIIASASAGVCVFFATIAVGQQASVNGKKATLDALSSRINSYSDLSDYLTIRDQLGNLSSIASNKKVLSRTFGVLSALIPTGPDTITISELNINLTNDSPTFSFDAQANAGQEPYIDYNVLDSFKKSMQYMRYDYGKYVDKNGAEIPAYCILESGTDGATFSDPERGYYAFWLITGEGCNPSYTEEDDTNNSSTSSNNNNTNNQTNEDGTPVDNTAAEEAAAAEKLAKQTAGYETEEYEGQVVVRIWRTPQFADWYKETQVANQPYMSLDGAISNVAHFESSCTTYSGVRNETAKTTEWSSTNNSCYLVPDGIDGINITDSSNGRGASDELVLRFSAIITLNPEVYNFANHHMLALGPSGRYNVTDSYVQIQNIFGERAADCAPGDTACNSANTNTNSTGTNAGANGGN